MPFGLLFVVSIIAGLVGSMSGIGAGILLIPTLTSSGVDIKQAIAISTIAAIAISISSASVTVRRHMPNLNVSAFLEVFAVVGAFMGASMTVVSARRPLFFLCGGTLLAWGMVLWRQQRGEWKPVVEQDAASRQLGLEGSYYDYAEGRTISYRGTHALRAALCMFGASFTASLLGLGGSALAVLIQEGVMRLPTKVSLTTSHLLIGVMALVGADVYLEAGLVNPGLAAPVILGIPLGALIGTRLLVHLRNHAARAIFLLLLIGLGTEMILQGIRGGRW